MSQVQTLALEMLMVVEQIETFRTNRERRRLALMDKNPELVKLWFPEWFVKEVAVIDSIDEVDRIVEHAMEGGEVIWEADENAPMPTPEEVEQLMRQLSTGSGSLGDLGDPDAGWT